MKYRYLDVAVETRPEDLPSAAIVDLLERGDLDDWRPIAAAVAADPRGAFAERVARLVDAYPIYGASPLWRAWIERQRARAEGPLAVATDQPATLTELRHRAGLTRLEVAERLGMSESDLSKLERGRDLSAFGLRAYAEALGARLRMIVERNGKETEIRLGEPPRRRKPDR